jgi:PAS domain S-box-containing protein
VTEFPFGADFQSILSLIGDGVLSTDHTGRVILFNRAAEQIFGYTSDEVLGGPIDALIPTRFHDRHREDVSRFCSSDAPLRRSMGGGREVLGRRKDGEELELEATLSRQMIGGQHIVTVVVRDVSARKTAERQRQLVASEVAHRLRNTMAVVDSIVTLTARRAASVVDFQEALQGRFAAIPRTNDALIRGSSTDISFRLLLESELAPYRDDDSKITLTGPDIGLDGQGAVALALVLHELATNAAKYGALSTSAGRLSVDWKVEADAPPQIDVTWLERNGPLVAPPTRRGFGSELIARSLGVHGGTAISSFAASGVSCSIRLPLNGGPRPPAH